MARGRFHDKLNYFMGVVVSGILIGFGVDLLFVFFFLIGHFFSTLVFSPDTDISPKKRSGILQFFLYPYSIVFRHRGISHSIFFGTLTRIFYGIIFFGVMIFVFHKMGYLKYSVKSYFDTLSGFIGDFDYNREEYRPLICFFSGMFLADLFHIIADRFSSLIRKIKPW